jgi:hypothetical protein
MITRENFNDVLDMITPKDKKRILNTNKEYVVLELHCTNNSAWATVTLTNDYNRYKNVSDHGNCILDSTEVAGLLRGKE